MNSGPDDGAARARDLFERAVDRIDADAATRLRQARRQAQAPRAAAPAWRLAVPLGVAAAIAVAFGLLRGMPAAPAPVPAERNMVATDPATPDNIERLLATDDADLYAWLAEAPVATGAPR